MLIVHTLGRFSMEKEGQQVCVENMHSPMLMKLFVYLLIHRKQTLTLDEIGDALWQEEEIANPAGAIKNLIYRLRTFLVRELGKKEYIITCHGAYQWNNETECRLDVEELEELYQQSKNEKENSTQKILLYEKIISLYQGGFMMKIMDMHWVITLNTYYYSIYLSCVKALAQHYLVTKQYTEMERVCQDGLNQDHTDEMLYYYLITARMKNHKFSLALDSYEKAQKILYEELGIKKSEYLEKVYKELLSNVPKERMVNVALLPNKWMTEQEKGAMQCGYLVFQEICKVEARRNADAVLLLTILPQQETNDYSKEVEDFRIRYAGKFMLSIMRKELQKEDVFSQYSDNQFFILLWEKREQGIYSLENKIRREFYENNPGNQRMEISFQIMPMQGKRTLAIEGGERL